MGAWGIGLFDDDVAVDVKLSFEGGLEAGMTVAAATRETMEEFEDYLDDEDDGPIVVLALAALQWERGKLQERLKKKAIAILESGQGLERWEDEGEPTLTERRQVYESLRQQLLSPPPAPPRRPRRPRLKINYQEGDWFGVPLTGGGYAVGILARVRKGQYGPNLFGYFFGPRRPSLPSLQELSRLTVDDAIYASHFGHMGLVQNEWPIIGRMAPWEPARWPLPLFGRRNYVNEDVAWLVEYSEETLEILSERVVKAAAIEGLPEDSMPGQGAVERWLSMLLPEQ
jgi:hypothetical protein